MKHIRASENLTVLKVHGSSGNLKMNKSDILTVLLMNSNVTQKIKSDHKCIVNFKCSEGEVKNTNDLLCTLSPCTHEIVISGLCGLCSMPVEIQNFGNGELKCSTGSRLAMLHSNKNVVVKKEAAIKISLKDYVTLLNKRKLSLLVDLDATILHSTDKPVPNDVYQYAEVYHYTMKAEQNPSVMLNYHTKFRPYLKQFLTEMNKYFEMHIYTFGNKSYAETITEFIDPDKRFFGQRIISKDDSFDPMKKSANLKSLFPRGDNMVCIIDDRTDVWNNAPNCIHVQPYMFFPETGDINDPYRNKDPMQKVDLKINPLEPEKDPQILEESKNRSDNHVSQKKVTFDDSTEAEAKVEEIINKEVTMETVHPTEPEDGNQGLLQNEENETQETIEVEEVKAVKPESTEENDPDIKEPPAMTGAQPDTHPEIKDLDCYLISLAKILKDIHKQFYEEIDKLLETQSVLEVVENNNLPDVKQLMTTMRSNVLRGCRISFSGLIPLNQKVKDSYEYRMLLSLGGEYLHELALPSLRSKSDLKSTDQFSTHLICKTEGTKKMKHVTHYIKEVNRLITERPEKLGRSIPEVHLVLHDWLWQSYFFWQKVNEDHFLFLPNLKQLPLPEGISTKSVSVESTRKRESVMPNNPSKRSKTMNHDLGKEEEKEKKNPVVTEEDLKELDMIDKESLSGISTDSFNDSVDSYNDKDVPLDNPVLHYSLQEQMEMFNEVDEAMDEEKYEKLKSPESSDYYNSGTSSSSDHSDNDSDDFKKPPRNWHKENNSNQSSSNEEHEMDYGDFEECCNEFGLHVDNVKSDFDDVFDDCNF